MGAHKAGAELEVLQGVMSRLRAEGGCPWDREQDLRSLRPFLLEEAFEVLEEMDRVGYGGSWGALCEELGDLLFQIVFHAQLAAERGAFDLADVCLSISQKLTRRHPHVFGQERVSTAEQVLANWAQLKAAERKKKNGSEGSVLDGVPDAAPALLRAERLTEKASRVGFDWPDIQGARAKLDEELRELDEAIVGDHRDALEHELGDVLLSVVNLSRFLKTPPEDALRQANHRFTRRFREVEAGLREDGIAFGKATPTQLDAHWKAAKAKEALVSPPRLHPVHAPLRLTFALPNFEAATLWRDTVFRALGWGRAAEASDASGGDAGLVRYLGGAMELAFEPGESTASPSLSLEAPSREAVHALYAEMKRAALPLALLAPASLAIESPKSDAAGRFALRWQDPSGMRWMYATT